MACCHCGRCFGLPGVLFFGNPMFPFIPHTGVQLLTYIGAPLVLPRIERPTMEDVNQWLCKYEDALLDLFEEFKGEAGYPDATLHICIVDL
eukprot:NODE_15318_length_1056_cov_5.247578.p3 GENE.NODE_15318_length_1056_cov_5.247578~~NODE_15318_length_1056_cov_5.247578.p3  ORF type:complete len:91 (+),score=24.30 NODE_15318_length_1056_cov_5.247578:736-1008(+)